jgi:hypothetical protein
MKAMNFGPPPVKTAVQFGETVSHDLDVWSKIATDAGIQID